MPKNELWGCLKVRVWDTAEDDYNEHVSFSQLRLPSNLQVRRDGSWRNIEDFDAWKYRFAVERCTGIKDHLGTWIYEGDIVERENQLFVVAWHKGYAAFVVIPVEMMLRFMRKGDCPVFELLSKVADTVHCNIGVDFSVCTVRGNIHTHRLFKEQQICREEQERIEDLSLSEPVVHWVCQALDDLWEKKVKEVCDCKSGVTTKECQEIAALKYKIKEQSRRARAKET